MKRIENKNINSLLQLVFLELDVFHLCCHQCQRGRLLASTNIIVRICLRAKLPKIKELKHKHNSRPKEYDQYENKYLKACTYTLGLLAYKGL